MEHLSRKQKIIITVLVLALLGILSFFFMCNASADNSYRGIGRQTFIKDWTGDVDTVSNVQITLSNGTIIYSGGLPSSDQISLSGITYGQTATITWNDWRVGTQTELVTLNADYGYSEIANNIPYPPHNAP